MSQTLFFVEQQGNVQINRITISLTAMEMLDRVHSMCFNFSALTQISCDYKRYLDIKWI